MDMQDFGFKHLSTSFYGPIKQILTIDQYYYPETLYKLFIINAPFSFRTLWAVVRPWLHPLTQARIQLMGGQREFLPKLREIADDENIPKYLGGSCTCCEETGLDKQVDRIYDRNCEWRKQRLEKAEAGNTEEAKVEAAASSS